MSPSRRVKVTSPQTRVALARSSRGERRVLPLPGPSDPARARQVFEAQRRLAIRTVASLGLVLFGTSGVIALAPALDRVIVAGAPVSWLMLAAATYPVLLVLAVLHVRAAERIDTRRGAPDPGPFDDGGDSRWPATRSGRL